MENCFPALFYIICGLTPEGSSTRTIHMLALAWWPFGLVENYDVKFHLTEIVGNKVKGQILKRVFQENKACQIFWKTNARVRIRG